VENDIYGFARKHGLNGRKIVDVSSGICPCGPSKKVKTAIRKAIRDIRLLPDPSLARLRKTVSSMLGIDGDSLIFGNTVEELLYLISSVFKPGKVGEEISTGAGEAGLVFISQPNRITGRLADSGRLDEMLDFCATRDDLAVVDESLIAFTGDNGSCERAAREEAVVVLRTTVNFYGLPGLGLAYAVSSPGIIERLNGKRRCEVSVLAAAAARAALRDKSYAQAARRYIAAERTFLVQSLQKIGGFTSYDSDSNVLLIKAACPAEEVSAFLSRHGFLISTWKTGDAPSETFFRLSVMEHEKNVKFLRILRQAALIERAAGGSVTD